MTRVKNAFAGVIFGFVLFFGSFVLLWWNEGNAVAQFKTIGDLAKNTMEVSPDRADPDNEGKPVYVSAEATTQEVIRDAEFAVEDVALRFKRKVEMYQWDEDKKTDSDTNKTTYSYSRTWSESHINSSSFNQPAGHENPPSMPYHTWTQNSSDVSLGAAYKLPDFLISDLNNYENLNTDAADPKLDGYKPIPNGFYSGPNPNSPEIGDVRVLFSVVKPGPVSLIAAQNGNSFQAWTSPKTDRRIYKILPGVHTKDDILARLRTEARILLWALRVLGFFLMYGGFALIAKPLSAVASFIPGLGTIVSTGVGLVGLLVAGIFSLLTIIVAWVAHRPLVGISLLVIVVALIFLLVRALGKGKKKAQPMQTTGLPADMPPPPPPPPPAAA